MFEIAPGSPKVLTVGIVGKVGRVVTLPSLSIFKIGEAGILLVSSVAGLPKGTKQKIHHH